MNNFKDNKNHNLNNSEITKKTSLPLIVGTSAMIIASVITLDQSVSLEVDKLNNLNSACYVQNNDDEEKENVFNDDNDDKDDDNLPDDEDELEFLEEDTLESSNYNDEFNPYILGDNGELFYDSTAEDDKYYYGEWDRVDSDDDDFIIW